MKSKKKVCTIPKEYVGKSQENRSVSILNFYSKFLF